LIGILIDILILNLRIVFGIFISAVCVAFSTLSS
jgi:hypothetical protein